MSSKIDEIDKKIIEILRENANVPNAKLGKKVGLSEPAARRRVGNLVARGTIRKFTIETGGEGGVRALVFLSTATHAKFEDIARDLGKEQGVDSVWEVSGEMDMAIVLAAPDVDSLNKRIDEIRSLSSIKKTKTNIILKKWK